jgi:[acyl-carrier-protein] S-malonyltransferase
MSEKLFIVFPGQGSQYSGMGADWFRDFPLARQAYEEASDHCGLDLKKLCFDGSDASLKATEITQPAILTTSIAIFRVLEKEFGLSERIPTAVFAGHSLGEYTALVASGALELGAAAKIVNHRGRFMQEAVPPGKGAMAALIFRPKTDATDLVPKICAEAATKTGSFVSVANYNSPEQIVISGGTLAIEEASKISLTEKYGARKAVPLPVSAPFQCELMKPAALKLQPELDSAHWKASGRNYVANIDSKTYQLSGDGLIGVAQRLVQHITGSVLWTQTVRHALSSGCVRTVEIGPGAVLSGLAKRIELEGRTLETRSIDRLEGFKNENLKF